MVTRRQSELTSEELTKIAGTAEPERSYDWCVDISIESACTLICA